MSDHGVTSDPLSINDFLEQVPPGNARRVKTLWEIEPADIHARQPLPPKVRFAPGRPLVECRICGGPRRHRLPEGEYIPRSHITDTGFIVEQFDTSIPDMEHAMGHITLLFSCPECEQHEKMYSLLVQMEQSPMTANREAFSNRSWVVFKVGEYPGYGQKFPNSVLRNLDRSDVDVLLKGKRSENQGLGIGAFAYYRLALENQRDCLIDQMIKAAEVTDVDFVLPLRETKGHWKFSQSIDEIKVLIPRSVYIGTHNPLVVLHDALSKGIHGNLTDKECLELASTIRKVLVHVVERVREITGGEREILDGLSRLQRVGKHDKNST